MRTHLSALCTDGTASVPVRSQPGLRTNLGSPFVPPIPCKGTCKEPPGLTRREQVEAPPRSVMHVSNYKLAYSRVLRALDPMCFSKYPTQMRFTRLTDGNLAEMGIIPKTDGSGPDTELPARERT